MKFLELPALAEAVRLLRELNKDEENELDVRIEAYSCKYSFFFSFNLIMFALVLLKARWQDQTKSFSKLTVHLQRYLFLLFFTLNQRELHQMSHLRNLIPFST
jgi:hypothetical protein